MTVNSSVSDIIGAVFVTSLFVGIIFLFSTGYRKVEEKFGSVDYHHHHFLALIRLALKPLLRSQWKQTEKLKTKGFEVSSHGINIQTQYDLSKDQLVQRASHRAQIVKEKFLNQPGLASFGHEKIRE